MRKVINDSINGEITRKGGIMGLWQNQHPVMYWWFAFTSISLCSVYVMIFTNF